MLRRSFLQTAVGSLTVSAAPTPLPDTPIRLGIDPYSIRDLGWKAMPLLEYAASFKLDAIQFSSLGDFESLEPEHLAAVKARAAQLGIRIDAGVGCICPTSKSWNPQNGDPVAYVSRGLAVAQAVGAKAMRCFLGSSEDRLGSQPIEAHMESAIKVFRAARNRALDAGVRIALENHSGDMQAHEVRTVIEESGKDFVGSCLDIGNPLWCVEDPMVTLEIAGVPMLRPLTFGTRSSMSIRAARPRSGSRWATARSI